MAAGVCLIAAAVVLVSAGMRWAFKGAWALNPTGGDLGNAGVWSRGVVVLGDIGEGELFEEEEDREGEAGSGGGGGDGGGGGRGGAFGGDRCSANDRRGLLTSA